ncbi:MAG: DNA translocase FtsK 4TM domain-containing protein, partial [Rhodobiaceae bacterium]
MIDAEAKSRILSPALIGFLRRRAMECAGLCLVIIGLALTAMLVSPGRYDPSFSAFSSGDVQNWFGALGSTIAGGLRVSLGTASFFLSLLPLGWGYRMMRKHPMRHNIVRLCLAPVSLLLLAAGFYGLSGADGSAAGGAAGVVLTGLTLPHLPPIKPLFGLNNAHYLGAGFLLVGLLMWSWCATLSRRQWGLVAAPVRGVAGMVARRVAVRREQADADGIDAPPLTLTEPETPATAGKKTPRKASRKRKEPTLLAGAAADSAAATRRTAGQGRLDLDGDGQFRLPPSRLLAAPGKAASGPSKQALEETAAQLEHVLGDFSVKGDITESRYGPVVTRHDLVPAPGTKSQRVISLADDIARSMSAVSVRVAVVPGQNVIGIELPNVDRQMVVLREIFDHAAWREDGGDLPMALGKDIAGAPVIVDLAKMP